MEGVKTWRSDLHKSEFPIFLPHVVAYPVTSPSWCSCPWVVPLLFLTSRIWQRWWHVQDYVHKIVDVLLEFLSPSEEASCPVMGCMCCEAHLARNWSDIYELRAASNQKLARHWSPPSHSHKELNSASKADPSSVMPHKTTVPANILIAVVWDLKQRTWVSHT